MNILIHGAINASNFGDCIFADMFFTTLRNALPNDNIWFYDMPPYGIGTYLRKHLNYDYIMSADDYDMVDVLIFISGGYFGENTKSLRDSIKRYNRYVKLGLKYIKKNVPILVLGLEVGPINFNFLKNAVGRILNYASVLTVRNKESLEYCYNVISANNAILTFDTALQIGRTKIFDSFSNINTILEDEKKAIFLHIPYNGLSDKRYIRNILDPVCDFCEKHKEYYIIYGMDNEEAHGMNNIMEYIIKNKSILTKHYCYTDYWELCILLSKVDFIVTTKLHVGIVGASYGKAIISTPKHSYKTERFYREIGHLENCVSFYELSPDHMKILLEQLYNKPIKIDEINYELSRKNLDIMVDYLYKIRGKQYNEKS